MCQRGLSVGFTTAASLVHELIEARDERRLLNLQKKLARLKLLIIDELGFVPLNRAWPIRNAVPRFVLWAAKSPADAAGLLGRPPRPRPPARQCQHHQQSSMSIR